MSPRLTDHPSHRRGLGFAAAALATIAIGLLVNRGAVPLTPRLRDATGDALWAMMMVWWLGVLWPHMAPPRRAAGALGVCVAVECSQLYHSPLLDALRATTAGHLVLGSGFDARDLVAYALGAAATLLITRRSAQTE